MRLKDSFAGVRVILYSHDGPPISARRRHNVTIGVDRVMRDFYAVTRSPLVIRQYAQSGDRGPVSMPDRKVCQRRYTRSTSGAAALTTREGMFAVCGPRGLPIGMASRASMREANGGRDALKATGDPRPVCDGTNHIEASAPLNPSDSIIATHE